MLQNNRAAMWFLLGLHTEGAPTQQALSDTGKGGRGEGVRRKLTSPFLALLTFPFNSQRRKPVMLTDAAMKSTAFSLSAPHPPRAVQHLINFSNPVKQHYPSPILLSLTSLFKLLFFASPKHEFLCSSTSWLCSRHHKRRDHDCARWLQSRGLTRHSLPIARSS